MMLWLVSGAYTGDFEYFAVFIHPFLSWIFSILFSAAPDFNWYAATWFVLNGLSFLQVNSVIEQTKIDKSIRFLLRIVFIALTVHFSLSLQFTQVAGFTAFAGLLGILHKGPNSFFSLGLPIVLILASLLIRWEAFVLVSLGLGWYYLWFDPKSIKSLICSRKGILLFSSIVLIVGCQKLHENYSEYADFMAFNRYRASVIDHPVLRDQIWYDEIQPGTELFYFSSWIFDENGFSNQELKQLKSELDQQILSWTHVERTWERTLFYLKTEKFKLLLIITFSSLYFWLVPNSGKKYSYYGLWLLLFFIANLFLVMQTRVNFFFFLILLFPILFSAISKVNKVPLTFSYLILGLSLVHFGHFLFQEFKFQKINKELLSLLQTQPKQQLTFLEEFPLERFKAVYLSSPIDNLLVLGWIERSPFQEKFFKNRNLSGLKSIKSLSVIKFREEQDTILRDYLEFIGSGPVQVLNRESSTHFIRTSYRILPKIE